MSPYFGPTGGGGGGVSFAYQFPVSAHGAKGDGKVITDAKITNGTSSVESDTAVFTSADTGKHMVIDGAGSSGTPLSGTITFVDATHVTISVAAGTTVTAAFAFYGTDDTAAIAATQAAAVTYAQSTGGYCEVLFDAVMYVVAGPLIQGGSTKGNAQLPLPLIATTIEKVTLVWKGVLDATAFPHWQQTVPQHAGTVIATTLVGQSYSATFGLPSIVGGPTPEQGYATTGDLFDNILYTVDGILLTGPRDPSVCGWDLMGVAEARILNAAAIGFQTPPTAGSLSSFMTGLIMPINGNNDNCDVGRFSVEGWFCGIAIGEHSNVVSVAAITCAQGIAVLGPNPHSMIVQYASIETCDAFIIYKDLGTVAFDAKGAFVTFVQVDLENGGTLTDSGNKLFGECNINNNGTEGFTVSGAVNLTINDLATPHGAAVAPAFPTTTTPLLNPFWRNAAVTITAGTVTAITVAGTVLGVTSGTVIVPSGQTIAVTYTGTPAWKWTLL